MIFSFWPLSGCLLGRPVQLQSRRLCPESQWGGRGCRQGRSPAGRAAGGPHQANTALLAAPLLRTRHGPNAGSPRSQRAKSGHGKSAPRFILAGAAGRARGAPAARTAVTDMTANRLRRNASSSSSLAPAFLNLLPFLTLTQSCNTGHLLHYHILGEFGEGGEEEGCWGKGGWRSGLAFEWQREPREADSWSPGISHLQINLRKQQTAQA